MENIQARGCVPAFGPAMGGTAHRTEGRCQFPTTDTVLLFELVVKTTLVFGLKALLRGCFPTFARTAATLASEPLIKMRLWTSCPMVLPPVATALCVPVKASTELTVPSAGEVPSTVPLTGFNTEIEVLEVPTGLVAA